MINNGILLENKYVKVVRSENNISWYDLEDKWNDYQGFTRNKRGLDKATTFFRKLSQDRILNDNLKMGDITDLLDKFNLKPHTYCGVD